MHITVQEMHYGSHPSISVPTTTSKNLESFRISAVLDVWNPVTSVSSHMLGSSLYEQFKNCASDPSQNPFGHRYRRHFARTGYRRHDLNVFDIQPNTSSPFACPGTAATRESHRTRS